MKKVLSFLFACMLLIGIMVGCSKQEESASNIKKDVDPATVEAIKDGTYKFEEPVTITTIKSIGVEKYKNGETYQNNVFTEWMKNDLGINVKYLWATDAAQVSTKLRLMLSSGDQMPDIISVDDKNLLSDLIESGQFKNVTEEFNLYASDKIKEIYSTDEDRRWSLVEKDGQRYGIPTFSDVGTNEVLWLRKDWLDQLGLKEPTTMDELETILVQFKEKNPGNVDNLIPLGLGLADGTSSWIGNAEAFFGPSGSIPNIWIEKDGELVYGGTQPEIKEGLTILKDYFEKGLISKDAGTHNGDKVGELVAQGKVGAFFSNWWAGRYPGEDLQNNVKGAELIPVSLPSINNKSGAIDNNYLKGAILVRNDFEHMDALMLFVNKIVNWSDAPLGNEFENGFAEGYDYVVKEDGTVSSNASDFPDGNQIQVHNYFFTDGIKDPLAKIEATLKIVDNPEAAETALEKKMVANVPANVKAYAIIGEHLDDYIPNAYLGLPTSTENSRGDMLKNLQNETYTNIIYGRKSMDDFDKFVEQWKQSGGDKWTNEINENMKGK